MKFKKLPYELERQVYGVGYFGYKYGEVGKAIDNPKLSKKCFNTWKGIMARSYDIKHQNDHPTYKGCTVDERWHCYRDFVEWFKENYYEAGNERMELDKDIIKKGNKCYSPDYCVFVPKRINMMFVKCGKSRGDLPIGVRIETGTGKYRAHGRGLVKNKQIHLGVFPTVEEAFNAYKTHKEQHIKNVADLYMGVIPERLYDAMYNYKVEIND